MWITLNDLHRATEKLKNRIFMTLARGIVKAVKNDEGTQKLQLACLDNELLEGVERLEEYGMATYPDLDAEAFAAFIGGNREVGVVLVTHDRRYRPKTLTLGEVMFYTKFGQTIHLKEDGSIAIAAAAGKDITVDGENITETAATKYKVTSPAVELSDGTLRALIDERLIANFNSHVHTGNLGAPTSAPTVPLVLADNATAKTKAG